MTVSAWALVPIKPFAEAKRRLEGPLSRAECAGLAGHMAKDVLRALAACPGIAGVTILSREPALPAMAEAATARVVEDAPGLDLAGNLAAEARRLAESGVRHLLVLPADLPTLSSADLDTLLAAHEGGLTVCPAHDGGTNALLVTPPAAIPFLYGPDSARRHLEAARERGLPARRLELPAFARDIDTADDVEWLLGRRIASASVAWLRSQGIARRLKEARSPERGRQEGTHERD